MGKKKTPRKGRTSEQTITESGLCIFKKGDQIKTLTNKRWDMASEIVEGRWRTVSFNGNILGGLRCFMASESTMRLHSASVVILAESHNPSILNKDFLVMYSILQKDPIFFQHHDVQLGRKNIGSFGCVPLVNTPQN